MRRSVVALTLLAALLGLGVVTSCIVRSRPPAHRHQVVEVHDHGKHKHKKPKKQKKHR